MAKPKRLGQLINREIAAVVVALDRKGVLSYEEYIRVHKELVKKDEREEE